MPGASIESSDESLQANTFFWVFELLVLGSVWRIRRLAHRRNAKKQRRGGPKGKAQRLFEEIGNLPRSRQIRILSVVEDLIAAHKSQ